MIKFITNSKALQVIDGASGVEVEVVVVDGVTDVEVDDGVNKELEFQLISIAELLSTSSSLVGSITQRDLLRLLLGIESQIHYLYASCSSRPCISMMSILLLMMVYCR